MKPEKVEVNSTEVRIALLEFITLTYLFDMVRVKAACKNVQTLLGKQVPDAGGAKHHGPLHDVSSMLLMSGLRERQALKMGIAGLRIGMKPERVEVNHLKCA